MLESQEAFKMKSIWNARTLHILQAFNLWESRAQFMAKLRMTYKLNEDQTFISFLPLVHVGCCISVKLEHSSASQHSKTRIPIRSHQTTLYPFRSYSKRENYDQRTKAKQSRWMAAVENGGKFSVARREQKVFWYSFRSQCWCIQESAVTIAGILPLVWKSRMLE